jgi:hypothetical protein
MNSRRLPVLSAVLVVVVLAACSNTSSRSTEPAPAVSTAASVSAVSTTTVVASATTTVVPSLPTTPTVPTPTTVVATTTTLPVDDDPDEYLVQRGPMLVELSANCFSQFPSIRVYGWIDDVGNTFETTARPQSATVVIDTNREFIGSANSLATTIYLGIDHFTDPGNLDFSLELSIGEKSLGMVMSGVDVVGECGVRVFWNQTMPSD